MNNPNDRRPLVVRNTKFANDISKFLAKKNITPNQISICSFIFSLMAAGCLLLASLNWVMPILAAAFIQCRLLCNLFDGMVAIEGGRQTKSGELFNDIPDRFADLVIFVAAGYSIVFVNWAETLGYMAALLAILTAYVRTLVRSVGAPTDFQGPMAKQHRMAIMTIACILTSFNQGGHLMFFALIIIILGSVITIYRRIISAYNFLENQDQ